MNRLGWSCTLTFKQFVAFLVTPVRSKNVRSVAEEKITVKAIFSRSTRPHRKLNACPAMASPSGLRGVPTPLFARGRASALKKKPEDCAASSLRREATMPTTDTLCGWGEHDRVTYYCNNVNILIPKRQEQLAMVVDLLGGLRQGVRQILDLGCGFGALTQAILTHYPEASITGVDGSAAMLALAQD